MATTPRGSHEPEHPPQEQPQQPPPKQRTPPPRDEKAEAEQRENRRISSYGAQVILDYDGDAALGARGGAADSVTENTRIRDEDLVRLGHNPVSPDNSLLATRPNFMPGKGPEPKRRAPGVPDPKEAEKDRDKAA